LRSDTISSVDSNVVDWVELGRTEATETRNEISDEVGALCFSTNFMQYMLTAPAVYCVPTRSP